MGATAKSQQRNHALMRTFAKIALVIPTLNEAGNISVVLDRALSALASNPVQADILVVDDESSDGTQAIVQEYASEHKNVQLIQRSGKRGLAGAILHGWEHTDADLLGVMDADLQHPPELLLTLIQKAREGFDLVIASRYLHGDSMHNWSRIRRFLSRLGVLASTPVQRRALRVKDPLSGFFVLRRECVVGMSFQESGFKLLLEILAKGKVDSVCEVPFEFGTRRFGESKADAMTAVHYFALLGKLVLGRKSGK